MIDVEELLKPVADDKPCGEDFSYHESFQELERLAKGTPEVEIGGMKKPAEDPNWQEVQDKAVEVLRQSKHLGAGFVLATALMRADGIEGLRDGLKLLYGTTEKYWPDLYPKLDVEDNNDPTERLNILGGLSGGKFIIQLKQVVLCKSSGLGPITLQHVISARERAGKPESDEAAKAAADQPSLSEIQLAFQDAGSAPAKASLELVNDAINQAQGLEGFLDKTLGAGRGVNFESLNKLLTEMKRAFEPYAVDGEAEIAPGTEDTGDTAEAPTAARPKAPGGPERIESPADVLKALKRIKDYYEKNEPSSPVPLILQRAERLVQKNFTEILTDLTPEALKQLQVITGIKLDKSDD